MAGPSNRAPPRGEAAALAACAALGVAGNVLAVALLRDLPGAYQPDGLAAWARGVAASPDAAAWSGIAFTLGLLALAGWGLLLARRAPGLPGAAGAALVAAGALLDGAGTLAAPVLAWHVLPACAPAGAAACEPVARALLSGTLALDALFNGLFGLGLVLLSIALRRARALPAWLAALGLLAGLVSIPVAGQLGSAAAQRLLAVAGPLWLAFVLLTAWPWRAGPTAAEGAP